MEAQDGDQLISKNIETEQEKKVVIPTYPLVRFTDVPEDTKQDIIDLITGTLERYIPDIPMSTKTIKERMDRLYGHGWHIVIGENFAFDVAYQSNHLLYIFFGGNLGILLWKCS